MVIMSRQAIASLWDSNVGIANARDGAWAAAASTGAERLQRGNSGQPGSGFQPAARRRLQIFPPSPRNGKVR
jgi:hypothetical protein